MELIEAEAFAKYSYEIKGVGKYFYICTPITIVKLSSEKINQTNFIFWN